MGEISASFMQVQQQLLFKSLICDIALTLALLSVGSKVVNSTTATHGAFFKFGDNCPHIEPVESCSSGPWTDTSPE